MWGRGWVAVLPLCTIGLHFSVQFSKIGSGAVDQELTELRTEFLAKHESLGR